MIGAEQLLYAAVRYTRCNHTHDTAETGGSSGGEALIGQRAAHQQHLLAQPPGHDSCGLQVRLCAPAWRLEHDIHTRPAGDTFKQT